MSRNSESRIFVANVVAMSGNGIKTLLLLFRASSPEDAFTQAARGQEQRYPQHEGWAHLRPIVTEVKSDEIVDRLDEAHLRDVVPSNL